MVSNRFDTLHTEFKLAVTTGYEPIQEQLAAVETRLRQVPLDHHDILGATTEHLFSAGGKRIRPAISLLAAGIFNADYDCSISLASGVEMLHTATLVHDDLIDGSLLRRGIPTLNADWSPDLTVLVGDYLFARAANLVAETDNVRIMDHFAKTLMVILNGEIAQRFSRWKLDRQEYEQRIYAKTGALFVLATRAAAILGAAEKQSQAALVEYGHSTGMAFQIVDDVLDFIGSPEKMGKPNGSDLRQGLVTLPVIYYAEAHPRDPDLVVMLEGNEGHNDAIPRLIAAVRESDAIDDALHEARQLVEQGQHALEKLPDSIYTQALASIANSIVERDR